jgi:FkbM family methyltransferase
MTRFRGVIRKLRLVARSDLVSFDKLRYVLNSSGRGAGLVTYRLRSEANRAVTTVALRKGTTDSKVFDEVFIEQAYAPCVAALPDRLGPVTLIDLGANIGLSAVYFAQALQIDEIIAVEPDPDNFRMLCVNLRRNRLANHSTVFRAFAGAAHAFAELHDSGNGAWGMRMGALAAAGTPVLPLAEIAGSAKTSQANRNSLVVLKCDIEGGERQLFLNIRDWDHLVHFIFLELHTEFLPVQEMSTCLESSGFQWSIHGTPIGGAAIALLLLERGERRSRPDS